MLDNSKVELSNDAFADLFTGNLNQSPKVRKFLQEFSKLIIKYHCTFLIVHHIGKGKEKLSASKENMLGSVGIEGKARQVLQLKKTFKSVRELWTVKGNYVDEKSKRKPLKLAFRKKTLHFKKLKKSDSKFTKQEPQSSKEKVERKNSPDPLI